MYKYTNKNGESFGITHETKETTIAYISGSYVIQADTDEELKEILNHFSHAEIPATLKYIGIVKG